jgi:hypothetical protein
MEAVKGQLANRFHFTRGERNASFTLSSPNVSLTVKTLKVKSKAIPVTGFGDSQGCEMLRLPHFPDNHLTDGGEVVSFKRRSRFSSTKIPGTHFC